MAMCHHISEGNDLVALWNAREHDRICLAQLAERIAGDLELAFNGRLSRSKSTIRSMSRAANSCSSTDAEPNTSSRRKP